MVRADGRHVFAQCGGSARQLLDGFAFLIQNGEKLHDFVFRPGTAHDLVHHVGHLRQAEVVSFEDLQANGLGHW